MKQFLFTLLALVSFCGFALAQTTGLQITEIMYNPPESGTDTLEFIEIYNASNTPLDITNYKVSIGSLTGTPSVRVTFPNGTNMAPHDVLVLAFNDSTFADVYGVQPDFKLTGSGLGNNGNVIAISDANGNTVTSVTYSQNWYPVTNNNGASLIRCNFTADINTADAWAASTNLIPGAIINGKQIYASPGAGEQCVVTTTPEYAIGLINTVNANGIVDSINVNCLIRGVVHSPDFRGGAGVEFALIDHNHDGIIVFSTTDVSGYNVQMGDSLLVKGMVSQYNGLLQFTPTEITVLSSNNTLLTPLTVTALDENTEVKLVQLENLVIDSVFNSTAAGFSIAATNASNTTFTIRIDKDVEVFTGTFNEGDTYTFTGIGSQFDTTNPFDGDYQLLPRFWSDIQLIVGVNKATAANLNIFPNPAQQMFTISTEEAFHTVMISNALGQVVAQYAGIHNNQMQISTENLANGLYQVTIISEAGRATKLVQIQK